MQQDWLVRPVVVLLGFSPGLDRWTRPGLWRLLGLPIVGWPRARQGTAAVRASRSSTQSIDCSLMRGGTSKGLFLRRDQLAAEHDAMLEQLRGLLGAGSARGVNGLGGLDPLANKIAVVDRSSCDDADVDYWFAQVTDLEQGFLDESVSCGNILAAVGPFAVESGLVRAVEPTTTLRIRCVNTTSVVRVRFGVQHGRPAYRGDFALAGVPGTGAPIELDYAPAGARHEGEVFPGGQRTHTLDGVPYTLIRGATLLLIARSSNFGLSGRESAARLNADDALLRRLEAFRREAARRCGLGDVGGRVAPKVALIAEGDQDADIVSRYFIPHACHPAHAVTGALDLALAARCAATVASPPTASGSPERLRIAHPSGVMEVHVRVDDHGERIVIKRLSVPRTARRLMVGKVELPCPPAAPHDA